MAWDGDLNMETVLIPGTSYGVGRAAAVKFIEEGYCVVGLDWKPATIPQPCPYIHHECDVSDFNSLPDLKNITYIVNNAGIVTPKAKAIAVNLIGYMNIIKKYSSDPLLKAIVQIGSTASIKGYDNMEYCVSQGGRDALTKWAANNLGHDSRHVLVNSLNIDGIVPAAEGSFVGTALEPELYADPDLMKAIQDLSITGRLSTVGDVAEWIFFLLTKNKIMTGEIIKLDGELMNCYKFIPYPGWDS